MATIKGIYRVLNYQGTYDEIHLKTDASQVIESDLKSFVSITEKTAWNNKSDIGHKHTSNDISDATDANTAGKIIKRDSNGDFSAGTITANLSGNASSATKLETARTINGIPFDGTNNITINAIPTSHNHDDLYKRKSEDYRITPKLLSKGQDLNLLYISGHYVSDSDGNSVTLLHRPPGSMGFSLEVRTIYSTETSAGRTIQIATMRENNEVYIRNKSENASWTNWIKQWNSNNLVFGNGSEQMARGNHTHNYLSLNGGIVNGNVTFSADNTGLNMYGGARIYKKQGAGLRLVPHVDNIGVTITDKSDTVDVLNVKLDSFTYKGNKVYHYGDKPTLLELGAAASSHIHNTSNITLLTGYVKPSETSALATTDNLNSALGKLEKGLEGKKDSNWTPNWSEIEGRPNTFKPTSHIHSSNEISRMNGYIKGVSASPITANDNLNSAISKLEVGLDNKMGIHTHPYRPNTWVPTWNDIASKPSFADVATSGSYNDLNDRPNLVTINDGTTTAISQTWSARKINESLSKKAGSSHKHDVSDITGLGSAATLDAGISSNQVLRLDGRGKVPISTLPSIAINDTFTVANKTAALALTVEVGDIVILNDDGKTYICVDMKKTVFDEKFRALSSGADSITKVEVETLLNSKVDKIPNKGLSTYDFNATYKNKLDGIAPNANNYVHPDDSDTRHVTDAQITAWNNKANSSHNHTSVQITDATSANKANTIVKRDANGLIEVSSVNLGPNEIRQGGGSNTALVLSASGGNVYLRPDKKDMTKELIVTSDMITFNGNKVYHAGSKPKPSEIGAAEVSHKHNYVPISSGGNITIHADSDASSTAEYVYLKAGHNILQVTSSGGGNTVTKGNDKLTFNGGKVYHAGNKPTPEEIGAAKATHGNHVPNKQSANDRVFLRNDNTWQALPNATINQTGIVQLTDSTSSQSTTTAATANSVKIAYDLANSKASSAHGHHNISSRGSVAMETGLNRPIVAGLSMSEVLNNGYPTTYGNVMTMRGRGDGQLLIGWPGTSGGHAPAYIRSKRDVGDAEWSQWAQIYTTANKPTLTDLGISTLNRGAYLTGSNYNGMTAVTWAVDATTTATPNKIAARDNSADISARLFRSSYPNDATISGAMAFRINNAGNNYIRFCSDTEAIRTFLSTYSKSQTYSRSEMDNRYRQKADLVFTNTISIVTPAA